MTSTERVLMTRRDYTRLRNKLNALRLHRSIPDYFGDYDANLTAVQRRIRAIQTLLTNAVVDEHRAGDGIAEPGMVLTIRYDATGETETFLLGRAWPRRCGAEDVDIKVYSMLSPLGRSIAGARPGDQRIYSIPDETGRLVTLLEAVPYERHVTKSARPHSRRATQ